MEYGLLVMGHISHRSLCGRLHKVKSLPEACRPLPAGPNANDNAKKVCPPLAFPRPVLSQNTSQGHVAAKLLSEDHVPVEKSVSIETPLGICRQSSGSLIDPLAVKAGSSHDGFRFDVNKNKSMPAICEIDADEESDCPEEGEVKKKVSEVTKTKKTKEIKIRIHSPNGSERKSSAIGTFFRRLFSCARSGKDNSGETECFCQSDTSIAGA